MEVFSVLPEEVRENYLLLATEYEKQETEDAKLVKQIDQIEMLMQALEYEKERYDRNKLQPFWDDVQKNLRDYDMKKIFELLEAERQE